jgi:hypothetical protein
MLRRCLLSSGSRVRILPGALGFWVLGRSRPDLPNAQRDASIPTKAVGYRLPGRRRGHGEDSIYWDESRSRYIGAVDLGFGPAGTRIRKKVSGKTKVEVRDKLRELHKETEAGLRPRRRHTVGDALEDWLAHGVDGLSERTVTLYRGTIVKALNEELGNIRLTELTASNVQGALSALAGRLSTRTVQIAHNVLVREQCE